MIAARHIPYAATVRALSLTLGPPETKVGVVLVSGKLRRAPLPTWSCLSASESSPSRRWERGPRDPYRNLHGWSFRLEVPRRTRLDRFQETQVEVVISQSPVVVKRARSCGECSVVNRVSRLKRSCHASPAP